MKFVIPKPNIVECSNEIHTHPCPHCPSTKLPHDPETEDILSAPLDYRIESAFPCAWRTGKYCKGYCDLMGITSSDLKGKIS